MMAAGYDVTVQPFQFNAFIQLGPSTLEQIAPASVTYAEGSDYALMSQTDPGDVTRTASTFGENRELEGRSPARRVLGG